MMNDTPLVGAKVLVVDDSSLSLKISQSLLESFGALYEGVLSGAEAIKACEEKSFDLILMEIEMPVMDGFEATMAIKKLASYQQGRPPVMAYTSRSYEEVKARMETVGMYGYVGKSFPVDRVIEIIIRTLSSY